MEQNDPHTMNCPSSFEPRPSSTPDICRGTFRFAVAIVNLCRELDQTPGVSRTLANQLLRSGTSIGANVEEGQGGQSKVDFITKYGIARKEARETCIG